MSDTVARAALLVCFPVAAAAAGSAFAAWRRPGPMVTSAVQHFAAGVVLAALAGEVLPDLRERGRLAAVIVGFSLGVALLLALGAYARRAEAAVNAKPTGSLPDVAPVPVGFLVAVAIDLVIDGLLVGLGVTLGSKQGIILTIALTIEVLFLGVSVAIELLDLGWSSRRAGLVSGALGLFCAAGAVIGAAALGGASPTVIVTVLAFGAAALLYLVVEELLVEAHEQTETPLLSAMFFAGFIGLYAIGG